jgi:hypothetical protein
MNAGGRGVEGELASPDAIARALIADAQMASLSVATISRTSS